MRLDIGDEVGVGKRSTARNVAGTATLRTYILSMLVALTFDVALITFFARPKLLGWRAIGSRRDGESERLLEKAGPADRLGKPRSRR